MDPIHIRSAKTSDNTHKPTPLLNKFDVAARCMVNWQTVLKWHRLGALKSIKLGSRTIRFSEAQVAAFLANRGNR